MVDLMKEFHEASRASFPYRTVYANLWFKQVLVNSEYLCLVMEKEEQARGMFIAHVTLHPFGPVKMANEIAWWVSPKYRSPEAIKMIHMYEEWAKKKGCTLIGLTSLDSSVDAFYRRRGFEPYETHYLKTISGA